MIRYFVAYAHARGFGRTQITTAAPITTIEQIGEIERAISGNGAQMVTVVSFQPLPEPTPTTDTRDGR